MRISAVLPLTACGLGLVCLASPRTERWQVREQETIQKTLPLSAPPMRVLVDNLDGRVHVRAGSGSEVRISAQKTIRAETDSDLADAKREVKLAIETNGGSVSVYYDAPWRCNRGQGCQGDHRRFYNVTYDIDVVVPKLARAVVSTVNNGDIQVDGVDGDFEISNVNGPINMTAIGGSGEIHTVNGPIAVHFTRNPLRPTTFKTVNGQLDAYFPSELSADLFFKTFNGEIYSDFEVTGRPTPVAETGQTNGKFVYRSNRARAARAGNGGPELSFDTLNGNIRLHREQ
jgi:hypothetical protein